MLLRLDVESKLRARSSSVKSESPLQILSARSNPDNPIGRVEEHQYSGVTDSGADRQLTCIVRAGARGESLTDGGQVVVVMVMWGVLWGPNHEFLGGIRGNSLGTYRFWFISRRRGI